MCTSTYLLRDTIKHATLTFKSYNIQTPTGKQQKSTTIRCSSEWRPYIIMIWTSPYSKGTAVGVTLAATDDGKKPSSGSNSSLTKKNDELAHGFQHGGIPQEIHSNEKNTYSNLQHCIHNGNLKSIHDNPALVSKNSQKKTPLDFQ
jgi:hypothetical protein